MIYNMQQFSNNSATFLARVIGAAERAYREQFVQFARVFATILPRSFFGALDFDFAAFYNPTL